jgi:hypothetical protein
MYLEDRSSKKVGIVEFEALYSIKELIIYP